MDYPGLSKVCDLEYSFLAKKQVGRLDVAVQQTLRDAT